ncbi:MAG: hypothetical protein CMI52_01415 [Parcubacteria group bacterium]|nr:hypothetical protein [Parcubacteria group bacterium]|tara:strand:+ start:2106 stop:2363 length:258 start_codon:yes stop_codon:yes gene_type:complete
MNKKKYYSTTEVAHLLNMSRIAIFKKIKNGDIKANKIGRLYKIEHREIAHLLQGTLTPADKKRIEQAVKKTVKEFGETLKLLGKE